MNEINLLEMAGRRHDALLNDLRVLIERESPSEDLAALEASAGAVQALIERELTPTQSQLLHVEGRTHVRARWGDGPCRVLVLAHHDTVWPIGTLQRLPWSVSGGVIRGPGCLDMKLGLVQAIHALAMLEPVRSLDGVTLLVTGDEELGSPTSRDLIEAEAADCRAVFVLESAGDNGAFKTARKGVSHYEVRVTGRAAHAGLEPENGVNAAIEMAHQLLAIERIGDPQAGTTVTPTLMSGGTTMNTVPAEARVQVDVRAWTSDEQLRVDRDMQHLRPQHAEARVHTTGQINRLPLEPAQSEDLYERAVSLAREIGIDPPGAIAVGGGSDGNLTAALGVPTLDGLGAVGAGAHAEHEHTLEAYIDGRVALLAALIDDVLAEEGQR